MHDQNWAVALGSSLAEARGAVLPWLDGQPRVVLTPVRDPAPLARWARELGVTHLVVAGHGSGAPDGTLDVLATVVAGAAPRVAVARRTYRTSTVSVGVLATTLVERGLSATAALTLLDRLTATTPAGVVLASVKGLTWPQPSFRQHLRSALPGGQAHLVTMTPKPAVSVLAGGAARGGPQSAATLITAGEPTDGVARRLRSLLGTRDHNWVPAAVDPRADYSSQGTEWVVIPDQLPLSLDPPEGQCPVCGDRVHGPVCPFCRVAGRPGDTRAPIVPVPPRHAAASTSPPVSPQPPTSLQGVAP